MHCSKFFQLSSLVRNLDLVIHQVWSYIVSTYCVFALRGMAWNGRAWKAPVCVFLMQEDEQMNDKYFLRNQSCIGTLVFYFI